MSFTAIAGPLGVLAFGQLTDGLLANRSDGSERRLGPGDVFLGVQPGHPFRATVENTQTETATIDPALLSQVADTEPGRAQQPVRITGYEPVSPQAARQWKDRHFYQLLNRMLFRAAEPAMRYRVLEHFYRLDPATIERFYAAGSTIWDKVRIMSGRPPVPIAKALAQL